MELTAAIEALKYFEDRQTITLITDSKYVKDGIQSWIQNWKKNGWKTAAKKPVKNKELWIELDQLILVLLVQVLELEISFLLSYKQ